MTINPKFVSINYSPTRFGATIQYIVLHTEDGYETGTASWFNNPASDVSAHYGVALTGSIDQFVSEGDTAWHAGNWPVNTESIGIETEDNQNPANVSRTPEQHEAVAQLIADVARRHGLTINRQTVIKHNEVPGNNHPNCPGNLDVDGIVARAQAILGEATNLITTAQTVSNAGYPVTAIDETVTVNFSVLRVHNSPYALTENGITADAGNFANTADGMVHAGDEIHIVGYVHTQSVTQGGITSDVFLETSNALGQHHWVWAGGTSFVLPSAPTPVPDPAPVLEAVAPVVQSTLVEPVVVQEPPVVSEPVSEGTAPSTTVNIPVQVATNPVITPVDGHATLLKDSPIIDLSTGKAVALAAASVLTITGTTTVKGNLYLLTPNMVTLAKVNVFHGIPQTSFKPVDEPTTQPTTVPTIADLKTHEAWIVRLLHYLTKKRIKS